MSEQDPETYLEGLDRLFPPAIPSALLEIVQEKQYAYDETNPSQEEIQEDLQNLDSLWPMMYETVRISGYAYMPISEDPENPQTLTIRKTYIEDELVHSMGFNAIYNNETEHTSQADSEGSGNSRLLLGLQFALPKEVIHQSFFHEASLQKKVFALPGDIIISRQEEEPVNLFDKIHHFFPELAEEIDGALLNASNTSDAVLSLADLSVRLDAELTNDGLKIITDYVNSRVQFDKRVPYHMDFEGKCFAIDPNEPNEPYEAHAKKGVTIAIPLKIDVLRTGILDSDGVKYADEISFGLRILTSELIPEDDDDTEYIVPLTEKVKMHDIRSLVYTAMQLGAQK